MNHQLRFQQALQSGNRLYRWQKYLIAPFKPQLYYVRQANNLKAALQSVSTDSPLAMAITWRPNYTTKAHRPEGQSQFGTAILHLANMRSIWLIHLTYMPTLHPVLREILENPDIVKVGVGMQKITQQLGKDFSVSIPNCVDIGLMANSLDYFTWNSLHAGSASAPPSLLPRSDFQSAHPKLEYGARIPDKFRPKAGPYLFHDTPLNTPNTPGTGKTYARGKPRVISGPTPPGGPPPPRVTGYVYRAQVSGSEIPQLPTLPLLGDNQSLQVRNAHDEPMVAGMKIPTVDDVGIPVNEMAVRYIARSVEVKKSVAQSDWQQVLDDEHLKYAANEVHVNLAIYLHLLDTFALRAREDWLLGPKSRANPRSPQSLLPEDLYPLPSLNLTSSKPSTPNVVQGRSVSEMTPEEVVQFRRIAYLANDTSVQDILGENAKGALRQVQKEEKKLNALHSTGALFAGEMRRAAAALSGSDRQPNVTIPELADKETPTRSTDHQPSRIQAHMAKVVAKAAANEKMKAQIACEVEMRVVAKAVRWAKRRKEDINEVVEKLSRNEEWPEIAGIGDVDIAKPQLSAEETAPTEVSDEGATPTVPTTRISKDELREEVRLRSLRAALNSPSRARSLFAFDSALKEGTPKIEWRG